ncbi:NADPH-dependent FMN reductase [Parapedobacter tibetensis]|uniref:NADPH-dependent FMN reductase n=1 Tax=Parapedobacter tibetensis TaxID=2972951 RepID=UPI00214D13BC|nr:NAD(P)H-dependent oxidoreductase [Parapedobacter tibetensis]
MQADSESLKTRITLILGRYLQAEEITRIQTNLMVKKKKILGICGSASRNSANLLILNIIAELGKSDFELEISDNLTELPHFKTELTEKSVPEKIVGFRNRIANADGIIICTPEYVFSIPSGLKNAIEWCVSTTVFSDKPIGLITASASGIKGHEELKLIMETVQTNFTDETTLLIQGIKGKVDKEGKILDKETENELKKFIQSFKTLTKKPAGNSV